MTTRIQMRRDTAANWTSADPVLSTGEPAYESDTGKFKIGDGVSNWSDLSYVVDEAGLPIATTSVLGAVKPDGTSILVDVDGVISTVFGLDDNTFTGDQTGGDNLFKQWQVKDIGHVILNKGSVGTGTVTFDYRDGSHQKLTITGSLTLATSNWPPTGNRGDLILELVNGGAVTVTFPTINWIKSDGSFTTSFSASGYTLQSSGTDFLILWSTDSGTTIYGKVIR